jgi:hypothetical protein
VLSFKFVGVLIVAISFTTIEPDLKERGPVSGMAGTFGPLIIDSN